MRLQQYLNEGRSVGIDKDTAISEIKKNCWNNYKFFLKKGEWIFRGIKGKSDAYLKIDSNVGTPRVSSNAWYNYYTLLMDNLPSWKKYPLRSRSIICSTEEGSAESYGTLYVVIPYDNTNVGIAPDGDIWYSFKMGILNDFNEFLGSIFRMYRFKVGKNDYKSLKRALIEINKSGEANKDKFGIFDKDKDVMKNLDKIMSPEYNGFKRGIKNMSDNNEIWIQGKSILVNEEIFWGIMEDIGKI